MTLYMVHTIVHARLCCNVEHGILQIIMQVRVRVGMRSRVGVVTRAEYDVPG